MNGGTDDYTPEDIAWVTSQFRIGGPAKIAEFPGHGNINLHTYEVEAEGRSYLLQKVNCRVFTMPFRVMKAMVASIRAQSEAMTHNPVDGWVPIELIPTRDGKEFLDLTDEHGWSVWRMMVRIPDSLCFKSLSEVAEREEQLWLAEEVGRGLAIYSDLTAGIDPASVEGSLPGYRDTGLYYRQFHSVMEGNRTLAQAAPFLPTDPILRTSSEKHFLVDLDPEAYRARRKEPDLQRYIQMARRNEPFAMSLWNALAEGRIRNTVIHGDTKIENFLFCSKTKRVKSLVDLDTIMSFTWLADWGDMIRSLVNVAGEREPDVSKVVVDTEVYEAVARGFLRSVREATDQELSLMVRSVQAITLELGVRFLTDYLRGDTYFQLAHGDPPDLNKTRAKVQLSLYERLKDFGPEAERRLKALRAVGATFH